MKLFTNTSNAAIKLRSLAFFFSVALSSQALADIKYEVVNLGTLGGSYSYGREINDNGQVTGYAENSSYQSHAFIYENGTMTDLGTLLGGSYSYGQDINDLGQVTGYAHISSSGNHAFIWDETNGMQDLNDLIDPSAGATLTAAYGINNIGQIVGVGYFAGEGDRAFLLNPISVVPEPSTYAMMIGGLGLVGLMVARRKKAEAKLEA